MWSGQDDIPHGHQVLQGFQYLYVYKREIFIFLFLWFFGDFLFYVFFCSFCIVERRETHND